MAAHVDVNELPHGSGGPSPEPGGLPDAGSAAVAAPPATFGLNADGSVAGEAELDSAADGAVAQWAAKFRSVPEGTELPAHSPNCLGCGPDNLNGLQMKVLRAAEGVRTDLVFDERHVGAPGVAHGGAVALAFDDLFGFLLYLVGELAVTRHLAVDYLAPVRLGVPYRLQARHGATAGRAIPVTAELTAFDGSLTATATATFLTVSADHFLRAAGSS